MARRKNLIKKHEVKIKNLFVLIVIFILLSLIIPAIGASATAPLWWINTVAFFVSVQNHFAAFWMFYSFAAAVLFAYFTKK